MANTLSVMTNVLRNVVSKQRIRYKEKGFNLDLAYICDNIIAMGYPADNIESFYRNRIEDVYKFFEENYHDHYKIYNLCLERSYDVNKFHGRVATYPFEDHNPPTIELIQKFCYDVDCWLKADPSNVAAIHCKAGKGRTGTMICCYLLYSGIQRTAEDALACYDEKRTKDRKGVTIPSQRRYVQYFSKLIQSGLPYERRALQFCEIRFADANLLHNQGVVNCSISLLHDISTLKVQTLQTHTIDFRKSMSIEINNPTLSVSGDIKVELTHKSSRKKIFHFWLNTYFVCDTADIEDNGEYKKFVYTLYKNEIDDAHKDKEHKYFSEDFKVQVVFIPVNSDGKNNSDRNILQQSGSALHSDVSQDLNCTQHKSILPLNSSSSSNLNYICDQKTSSSASACSLNVNKTNRYMDEGGECAQKCGSDDLQTSFTIVKNTHFNKMSTPTSAGIINEKVTNERKKKSTASIPTNSCPILKSPHPTLAPTFYQNQNYKLHQNHFQLETDSNCLKKHQVNQEQPNEERHKPSVNDSKSTRSKNKKSADSMNIICINRHVNDTSGNSNSNECSSSSISSHSSSSAPGDNEEDWESGESSPKLLAHNKELFSSPTSNINTRYSLNLYNGSSCIENKIDGDDDDEDDDNNDGDNDYNDKCQYINEKDNEAMTIFNTSNLEKSCGCCRNSIAKPCKPDTKKIIGKTGLLDNQVSITLEQSKETIMIQAATAASANNKNKNHLLETKSLKSTSKSTSKVEHEQEATCSSLSLHCGSSTGLTSTSKQKLRMKLKKNKIKLSEKFQWFQKYFRNDPIDFCENFVQQTTAMRRNSNCSVTSRSHKLSTTTPPPQLGCFPRLSSLPLYVGKPANLDVSTEQTKYVAISDPESVKSKKIATIPLPNATSASTSVSAINISTVENYDFYSSICDKQLSFTNSPCKNPRSLVDIVLASESGHISVNCAFLAQGGSTVKQSENYDVNEKLNSKDLVVVAAKPTKTNAIGFNIANLSNTTDSHKEHLNSHNKINQNSKDFISNRSSTDINTDESNSILFPFEFANEKTELDKLEKTNNSPPSKTSVIHVAEDEKIRMENSKTGRDTILNLVIIKETNNAADQTLKSQYISPEKTKSHNKYTNACMQVGGGGNIVSDSSNSSSSGFCTSECCTNSSSSSACSCNPFALDLERHTATNWSGAEESNEHPLHESSALTKSNTNNITRGEDVKGVLERTLKQFVDY